MNPHLTVPAAPVCAFFNFIFQQLDWRWLKGTLRNIAVAACLVLPLAMTLQADEPRPNWLPEAIELPADNDVLMDRSIGSSLRMFSFSTEHNTETLLEDWEEALRLAGYSINQTKGDVLETAIEFSGQPGAGVDGTRSREKELDIISTLLYINHILNIESGDYDL